MREELINAIIQSNSDEAIKLIPNIDNINERFTPPGRSDIECTFLVLASAAGLPEVVSELIKNGANVHTVCKERDTPYTALSAAMHSQHEDVAIKLIESGALKRDCLINENEAHNIHKSWLHQAIGGGQIKVIEKLIEYGVDIQPEVAHCQVTDNGYTMSPLYASFGCLHESVSKLLIQKGADINKKDPSGFTPLYQAIFNGTIDVASQIIESGADLNITVQVGDEVQSNLFCAIFRNNVTVALKLIKKGANTNIGFDRPNTVMSNLYLSITNSNTKIALELIDNGADLDFGAHFLPSTIISESTKVSNLNIAIISKLEDVVTKLIEKGANINVRWSSESMQKCNVLLSLEQGLVELGQKLIEKDCDLSSEAWAYCINGETDAGKNTLNLLTKIKDSSQVASLQELCGYSIASYVKCYQKLRKVLGKLPGLTSSLLQDAFATKQVLSVTKASLDPRIANALNKRYLSYFGINAGEIDPKVFTQTK